MRPNAPAAFKPPGFSQRVKNPQQAPTQDRSPSKNLPQAQKRVIEPFVPGDRRVPRTSLRVGLLKGGFTHLTLEVANGSKNSEICAMVIESFQESPDVLAKYKGRLTMAQMRAFSAARPLEQSETSPTI